MVLPILMVYGPGHVAHIRNVVIPALAAQGGTPPLALYLVNYEGPAALLADIPAPRRLEVLDLSAEREPQHIGFGEGINYLFAKAKPDNCFLALNPDTIPEPQCIKRMLEAFVAGKTGIVEARQWPSEHPKSYDRKSGVTDWASGACALIASDFFNSVGGFDPTYFLYCEDVDLSWRAWLEGREVVYAPKAGVAHFTGLFHYRSDRYYYEHFYSARNFIVIARKFFGAAGEKRAIKLLNATSYPKAFKHFVLGEYEKIKPKIREVAGAERHPHIQILGFNCYHTMRGGA